MYPVKCLYSARRTQPCDHNGMSLHGHSTWLAMSGLWTRPFLIGTLRRYTHHHTFTTKDSVTVKPGKDETSLRGTLVAALSGSTENAPSDRTIGRSSMRTNIFQTALIDRLGLPNGLDNALGILLRLEFDDSFYEIIGVALFPAFQKQRTEAVGGSSGDYGSVIVLRQTYSAAVSQGAAGVGHNILELLLSYGADVRAQDLKGSTPYEFIVKNDRIAPRTSHLVMVVSSQGSGEPFTVGTSKKAPIRPYDSTPHPWEGGEQSNYRNGIWSVPAMVLPSTATRM
ncbi:hypothetical protein EDD85DRAFT_940714 [Armillaria nabsnona]|nr:hypothetical protein EDD85DRAFT_940714 [Armillaria nabsnona]